MQRDFKIGFFLGGGVLNPDLEKGLLPDLPPTPDPVEEDAKSATDLKGNEKRQLLISCY